MRAIPVGVIRLSNLPQHGRDQDNEEDDRESLVAGAAEEGYREGED